MTLVDPWLQPELPPARYVSDASVMSCRRFSDGRVIAEVFRRDVGSFGGRFVAWIARRDAGDMIRDHAWDVVRETGIIAESLGSAQALADLTAQESGLLSSGPWTDAV